MTIHVLNAYHRLDIAISHGDGCYLYDLEGKSYLDFASGIAVNSLGHNHPHLNQALTKQLAQLWHCSNIFQIPQQTQLAQRLNLLSNLDATFFCSSGLEAVETALKLMRKYHFNNGNPMKNEIISFKNGFHGRSIAALSAGGNHSAKAGYGPFVPGFSQAILNDITSVKTLINNNTAGILIEPIQSEGGGWIADPKFLLELKGLANQYQALICFDEVQTGLGRTGSFFNFQQTGIKPDLITLAKAMGNGFPLAACICNQAIADSITPGSHGSTYGGNPLAMAVGNAVLDLINENLLKNVKIIGKYLKDKLNLLQENFPHLINEVRGSGLMLFLDLNIPASQVMQTCVDKKLIVTRAGDNKVLRLLPPLIISEKEANQAITILYEVFKEYE